MDNTDKHLKDWLKFLDANEVKFQLTTASIYLTAYDLLITNVVEKVRDFYVAGFDQDGEIISDDYKTNVRGLYKSDIVIASLLWLKNNNALNEEEVERINFQRT